VGQKRFFVFLLGIIIVFCIISLGVFLGCQPYEKEQQLKPLSQDKASVTVEKDKIKQHIDKLTSNDFQGRRAGTTGEAEAALYLAEELKKLNLRPLGNKNTYFQTFPIPHTGLRWEEKRLVFYLKDTNSQLFTDNVLGLIEGSSKSDEYILLSAHFDHMGIWENQLYPGANDNASGVGAVLEIARVLKSTKDLPYSIIIAFWGGEEMGLIGSNFFVERPTVELSKVKLAINFDSIGSGAKNDFLFWTDGPQKVTDNLYNQWKKWQDVDFYRQETSANTSDHKSLGRAQIPAVTILAKDWLNGNHTTQDNAIVLNYQKIAYLAQKVSEFLSSPEALFFKE